MKSQTWSALGRRAHAVSRPLRLSLVLCGGVIAACGDTVSIDGDAAVDAEAPTGQGGNSAGRGGRGAAAGNGGSTAAGTSGAAGQAAGSGAAGLGGRTGAGSGGTSGSDLDAGAEDDAGPGGADTSLSFFVTSDTRPNGNLGGLSASDQRCQDLAAAVGAGSKTWHAYLSADADAASGGPVNARDRIGAGPWYNQKGVLLAADVAALHQLPRGDAELFLDEKGAKINGQWEGSPTPNEHDIFTGSNADGTLSVGNTCKSWTSSATTDLGQVGHSDGLGPMRNGAPPYNSWNSVHTNENCSDTKPRGGAGKVYCFAID
jgi:hypothetical protein